MATISNHTLHGTQTVVLTEDDLTGDDGAVATEFDCNGAMVAVPDPFPAAGSRVTSKSTVATGPASTAAFRCKRAARDQAWSGTAHALVAELGVGAVTHSTLMMGLGVAGILGGLGLVFMLFGGGLFWASRGKDGQLIPDTVPEAFLDERIDGPQTAKV